MIVASDSPRVNPPGPDPSVDATRTANRTLRMRLARLAQSDDELVAAIASAGLLLARSLDQEAAR